MEDGVGGTHSSPTGDKRLPPTHPKFLSLVLDWEGAKKCFILRDQTIGDLKSHHLQARATLTAMSVPPEASELWVIRYHLGYLGIIMHYRIYSQYDIMRKNVFWALIF